MAYCTLEFIQDKLSNLPLKSYNQYQWWRRFDHRRELSEKAQLRDKILHGDFEVSDYLYQAELEEYLLEEKEKKCKTADEAHELRKLFHERRRRLIEDYEKEENKFMEKLLSALRKEFSVSNEYLMSIMENFDGTTLELYDYLQEEKINRINKALKNK